MDSSFGRNRQSIADIEQDLYDIFVNHPNSSTNDDGEPTIPGASLVDIFREFSRRHDSDILNKDEEVQMVQLIESNPGIFITPQILLSFIAMRTKASPENSPEGSPSPVPDDSDDRGRQDDRDDYYNHSRSSSRGSNSTSIYRPSSRPPSRPPSRPSSRGPSVPPKTPTSGETVFDKRQRTTPLQNNAPSSWTRRPPPARRKSDASAPGRSSSDSESYASPPPVSFSRSYSGRSRAPSNPTSPHPDLDSGMFSPPHSVGSPPSFNSFSRPHSRAQSQPQSAFDNMSRSRSQQGEYYGSSPERDYDQTISRSNKHGLMSPPPSDMSFDDDQNFATRINSLPMPNRRRSSDSDSDSDPPSDEDDLNASLGLVMDRSAASSTISLDLQERLDAMQKINTDLGRKLMEAERTLQMRLNEHELELEDMQVRLEEARSELSATKREEKELRSKEQKNSTQISTMESEIVRLTKALELAKLSYQNLQKQYTEQCAESERYRDQLRARDEEVRGLRETAASYRDESAKWVTTKDDYENRIAVLEADLVLAQQTVAALDEQKQENLLLKETIDRMRFDMDEMRTNAVGGVGTGISSNKGSVSKSLGAEMLSQLKSASHSWEDEVEEASTIGREELEQELLDDGEDTEGEDIVQTIITRKTRKVGSRAKRIETINFDEVKEYSDAAIQHEPSEFSRVISVQTDPPPKILTASFSIQTDDREDASISIQTEPEPVPLPIATCSIEIQTDMPEPEPVLTTSISVGTNTEDDEEEAMTSSSSTILPPTPKAQPHDDLHPSDLPPAYHHIHPEDPDQLALRIANETLKTWHKGLQLPIEPVPGGVSEETVEDWKALKEELGIECTAIDRLIEESARNDQPRPAKDGRGRKRSGRFYNIYNTYVYGNGDREGSTVPILSSQFWFCIGASAAVAFLVGHSMAPQYSVPGGATYYDRAAWSSFNSMQAAGEGFPGDGTAAVWGFLNRLGGGAARTLRGWPT